MTEPNDKVCVARFRVEEKQRIYEVVSAPEGGEERCGDDAGDLALDDRGVLCDSFLSYIWSPNCRFDRWQISNYSRLPDVKGVDKGTPESTAVYSLPFGDREILISFLDKDGDKKVDWVTYYIGGADGDNRPDMVLIFSADYYSGDKITYDRRFQEAKEAEKANMNVERRTKEELEKNGDF